jgi:prephenate dehydrogenase
VVRRVALIGTGLIGGSIGLALTRDGADVRAYDADPDQAARAVAMGAVADVAFSVEDAVRGADVTIVATPVGLVAELVVAALDAGAPVVTDVGSVKAPILREVEQARPKLASRFVGGHPMAGSEQDGLDGAAVDLFAGATWVLTPTDRTDPDAHTAVRSLVAELGAEIIEITPLHHDALVAVVSHVPQLAATTLMDVAATTGEDNAILLRLAAGGFRDMTRIAAGHPGIWPDICMANRDAIVAGLDDYLRALAVVRGFVAQGDSNALLQVLERARSARRNLPRRATVAGPLVELRVPVPDRPGVLAEVTMLASRLGVNIADLEIAHSMEGEAGVIVMVVSEAGVESFESALVAAGYHVARSGLP